MKIKNDLLSHKKQEAHLVENCKKTPQKKKFSASSNARKYAIYSIKVGQHVCKGLMLQFGPPGIMPEEVNYFLLMS